MRSSKSPREFFQKMKKKPALQAILDSIESYTVEELSEIKSQPKWIREQLVRIRTEKDLSEELHSENISHTIAAQMDPNLNSPGDDRVYQRFEVRQWFGGTWCMPCGRTGEWKTDIDAGDLFLILAVGRAKFQCSISNMNQQQWNYFQQNTQHVGYMDVNEFACYVNGNLEKKHPDAKVMSLQQEQQNPNVKDMGLFTIFRH